MLTSLFNRFGNRDREEEDDDNNVTQRDDQQRAALQENQKDQDTENYNLATPAENLRALWERGGHSGTSASNQTTEKGTDKNKAGAASESRTNQGTTALDREDADERKERLVRESKDNFAKAHLVEFNIETVGDAFLYCKKILNNQLERADASQPPMNESVYGDFQARRAIATLLPDSKIRELFLETTRNRKAWPRLRPLFGAPPYHFLRPEDAGLIRAAGMSSGRVNMTYDTAGQTAAYGQFGAAHLVDDYFREYRILPTGRVDDSASLPCDLDSVESSARIYMNVRVPKRSREEKIELLKDQSKRKAAMFPYVGETLKVKYSTGLREVWGIDAAKRKDSAKVVVKRMVPRSSTGSTAAVVAVLVD